MAHSLDLRSVPAAGPAAPAGGLALGVGILGALLIGLDFTLVGRITGAELVFLVYVPLALATGAIRLRTWPVGRLVGLALVWLAAQITSDLVQETEWDNMARGAARAGVTAVLLLGYFATVRDNLSAVVATFVAMALGLLLGYLLQPSEYALHQPWKFGYGVPATMLALAAGRALFWRTGFPGLMLLLCLALTGLNLAMGFRSLAAMTFMAGTLSGLSVAARGVLARGSSGVVAAAAVVLVLGVAAVTETYSFAARGGLLGGDEQERYEQQVGDNGVILSGRAEILVSTQAILDRPLLGHGSWASSEYYSDLLREAIGLHDFSYYLPIDDAIPSHSHLFGAWVEGGAASALIWLYVLYLVVRATVAMLRDHRLADPVLTFILFNLSWAVLFSPYGMQNRPLSCFGVIAVATVLRLAGRRP